jgi:hypothetical protein
LTEKKGYPIMELDLEGLIAFDGCLVTVEVSNPITGAMVTVQAQVDPGASHTCVRHDKVTRPIGVPVHAVAKSLTDAQTGQTEDNDTYLVRIAIIGPPKAKYVWEPAQVIDRPSALGIAPFDVLIGRDMLERCVFTYDGTTKRFKLVVPTP